MNAAVRACDIATVVTPSHYNVAQDFSAAALACDTLDGDGEPVAVARLEALLRAG